MECYCVPLSWFAKKVLNCFIWYGHAQEDYRERVDYRKICFNVIYAYYHQIARCKWHFAYYKAELFLPFGQGSLLIYTCTSPHLYPKIFLLSMSKQFDMMPFPLLLYWSSTCNSQKKKEKRSLNEQAKKLENDCNKLSWQINGKMAFAISELIDV